MPRLELVGPDGPPDCSVLVAVGKNSRAADIARARATGREEEERYRKPRAVKSIEATCDTLITG